MSEHFPSPSNPESKPSKKKVEDEWYPSDDELAAFERAREMWKHFDSPGSVYPYEHAPTFEEFFGRPDPRIAIYEKPADFPEGAWYPTDDELAALERARKEERLAFGEDADISFYDYFGHPDPRVKRMVRPDELESQRPESDETPDDPRT